LSTEPRRAENGKKGKKYSKITFFCGFEVGPFEHGTKNGKNEKMAKGTVARMETMSRK
jgi:hypothetical protein